MKPFIFTFCVLWLGIFSISHAQLPYCDPSIPGDCISSMQHYWKLDETSGTKAYDAFSIRNGVFVNGGCGSPIWYTPGKVNRGVKFCGWQSPTIENGPRIDVGNLNFISSGTNGQYTIALWVKLLSYEPATVLFSDEGSFNKGTMVMIDNNGYLGTFRSGWHILNSPSHPKVTKQVWHHIVYRQDATGIYAYLDGSYVGKFTNYTHVETNQSTTIGSGSGGGRPANAIIDEVAVFNKALTATQINALYLRGNTPAPVELSRFDAKPMESGIQLEWATASELNNDFFTLERSQNGQNFQSIIQISGAGNSNQMRTYHFLDPQPWSGKNYYRLKQTDFDGQSTYSPMLEVSWEGNLQKPRLYPNPVVDQLYIELPEIFQKDGPITVGLYNLSGKLILFTQLTPNKGTLRLEMGELPGGVYMLKVHNPLTSQSSIHRIVK